MSDLDAQLAMAARLLRHSPASAVEQTRRVLTEDPNFADAHALLSIALLRSKRIHAAEYEAREALRLEPVLGRAHAALGLALLAQRKLADAEVSLTEAVNQAPNVAAHRMSLAELRMVQGQRGPAIELLRRAVTLDPEDADALAALGRALVDDGKLEEAAQCADAAAAIDPGSTATLVLRGHLALRRGNPDQAKDFALWALAEDANDGDALQLLVDLKARQSWVLGLWWRYVVFMVKKSDRGQIVTLITAFLLVQLAAQAAGDLQAPRVAELIRYVWLGVVFYSFAAPGLYRRMIEKEQKTVRLRDDF